MAIKDNDAVKLFFQNDIKLLVREDLGSKSFVEVEAMLVQIRNWILEMIEISDRNPSLKPDISSKIYEWVNVYNAIANELKEYNLDADAPSSFRRRTAIVSRIQAWFDVITIAFDTSGENKYRGSQNFLTLYTLLKLEDLKSLANQKGNLDEMLGDIASKKKEYSDLVLVLQQKAASETTIDYAAIFEKQSSSYSNFTWRPFKVGGAERWLFISVLFIISFVIFLHNINSVLPVKFDLNSSEVTVQLLTRLVVISFFIYVITMVIRQYSVQKHLATLNRHRQNVLNSFNLFIHAIDKEDTQTRNALMMEVAKAIYESGQTGYVSTKDGDSSSSLIEMTKYISPSKS